MKKKLIAVCLLVALVVVTATAGFAEGIQPRAVICPNCDKGHMFDYTQTTVIGSGMYKCPHCMYTVAGTVWRREVGLKCGSCGYFAATYSETLTNAVCPTHGVMIGGAVATSLD